MIPNSKYLLAIICALATSGHLGGFLFGQGTLTTFTYQGELVEAGRPANGTYDFEVKLFYSATGGSPGGTLHLPNIAVNNGEFTLELDFGANSLHGYCWIEIIVDGFVLSPRQRLTYAPFAIQTRGVYVNEDYKVGIGTGTPEGKVHIMQGAAGVVTAHSNSSLVLERMRDNFLSMLAPTADKTGILFGHPLAPFGGGIVYNEDGTENGFEFRTGANQTRMIIDHDGRVGIGNFAPTGTLSISGTVDPTAIFALNSSASDPTVEILNVQQGFALTAYSPSDVSASGGGIAQFGTADSVNIAIDHNEIMARNNGAPSTLFLNAEGGDIRMGAQSVKPPLAYGRINGDGRIDSKSINVTSVTRTAEGRYTINVSGGIQAGDVIVVTSHNGVANALPRNGGYDVAIQHLLLGDDIDSVFFFVIFRP